MNHIKVIIGVLCLPLLLIGCVNNAERLGAHVTKVRAEQTYNPNATQDNLGVIPSGSGERMEGAYQVYTGKKGTELKGTESQFLEGGSE
ncbi:hypothetical protein OPW19_24930 [Vibrio europaeus]|uniref:hypothetical protein n=1 Tax=Vibrio europaeus TaxID=300876 RepID=UPI00233EA5B7|nr:hypothetical protein [Vibrio europaeus]MDC5823069.1 hypothetical protein [Vibrio europaeus]MDC5847725.1 hypothetical protein [Vibrio europaeus]MDC5869698.1 hypothetical protein [Vibrio europaeus]